MDSLTIGFMGIGAILVLLAARVPIAFALGSVSFVGIIIDGDPNELLPGDGICLVEHASDLIIVVETDGVDDLLELVADVQFVFHSVDGVRISNEVTVCIPNNGRFDNNTTKRTYAHRRAAG